MARIYDDSDRPAQLPIPVPEHIDFATVQENDVYVCSGLNLDIASQGDTPEEAEENFREAVVLYYADQFAIQMERSEAARGVRIGGLEHA